MDWGFNIELYYIRTSQHFLTNLCLDTKKGKKLVCDSMILFLEDHSKKSHVCTIETKNNSYNDMETLETS